MIYYRLGDKVEASSTCIGDAVPVDDIITPAHQAHSTNVVSIPEEIQSTYGVDALITDQPGVRIGVRTADCVPILIYDSRRHAAAAIHSGWKGTRDNIISHAIERMHRQYGCQPCDMHAVIGPCIHIEAFEVGDEVYDAFCSNGYQDFARRMCNPYNCKNEEKWHIDLPSICRSQLSSLDVPDIYTSPYCTYRCHDRFYSYRYSGSSDRSHRIITSIRLL